MAPSPYAVLGVPRDATPQQIRRAYKALSLQLHPDKNPDSPTAATAFNNLTAAYDTLSQPARRAQHDRAASAAYTPRGKDDPFADADVRRAFADAVAEKMRAEAGGAGGHLAPDEGEMFESLFGRTRAGQGGGARNSGGGGGDLSGSDDPAPEDLAPWKPPDHEVDLPLTLPELFSGCVKKRRLRKQVLDPVTGSHAQVAEILTIAVRPGYRPGDKIRFAEAGDHGHGITPADVVFVISALPHPRFSLVDGSPGDLRVDVSVGLADALAGCLVRIESLAGDPIIARTTDVVTPGQVRRVRGRGMPRPAGGKEDEAGPTAADLLIHFHVVFPPALTAGEKVKIRDVFAGIDERVTAADPSPAPGVAVASAAQIDMRRTSSMFSGSAAKRSRSTHNATSSPRDSSPPHGLSASSHSPSSLLPSAAAVAAARGRAGGMSSQQRRSGIRGSGSIRSASIAAPDDANGPSSSPHRLHHHGRSRSVRGADRADRADARSSPARHTGKVPIVASDSGSSSDGRDVVRRSLSAAGSGGSGGRSAIRPGEDDDDDEILSVVGVNTMKPSKPLKKKSFFSNWMSFS